MGLLIPKTYLMTLPNTVEPNQDTSGENNGIIKSA